MSSFCTFVFSLSVCVSTVLLILVFFSGTVWDVVEVFPDFVFSATLLAIVALRSTAFELVVGVFESEISILVEFVVLAETDFWEFVDV